MKDKWILINKNNGRTVNYNSKSFNQLADTCKSLLALKLDDVYEIEYWKDGKYNETDKMSTYFSLKKIL